MLAPCDANPWTKVLVWDSIDTSLAGIIQTWWEDDKVTQSLEAFRGVRCLFINFRSIL